MATATDPREANTRRPTRGQEMHWERWCDGQHWTLIRGEDFEGSPHSKRSSFRQWAERQRFVDQETGERWSPDRWHMATQVHNTVDQDRGEWMTIHVEGGIPQGAMLERDWMRRRPRPVDEESSDEVSDVSQPEPQPEPTPEQRVVRARRERLGVEFSDEASAVDEAVKARRPTVVGATGKRSRS